MILDCSHEPGLHVELPGVQGHRKQIDIERAGNNKNPGGVLGSLFSSFSVLLCLVQIEIIGGGGGSSTSLAGTTSS